MKKRFIVGSLLVFLMCLVAIAASAAVTISGYDPVDMQIGLNTARPSSGGFYSRGVEFHYAIDGNPTDTINSTIIWSVTPTNGGPALTITPEGTGRESARAWLNLDSASSYSVGKNYSYDLSMNINGTITTRSITVNFVNNALPTGYGLTVTPVTFTSSAASLGTPVSVTNGEMYNATGKTYVVSIEITGTSMDYSSSWRDWSDTEWEELNPWDDTRLSALNLDGGKTGIYTAKKMGTYPDHNYIVSFYGNNSSNIACYIPYTLYVTDANGNLPPLVPEIHGNYNWSDWNATSFNYLLYSDLGMDSNAIVWQNMDVINLNLSNAGELAQKYGGSPVWNVTDTVISGEKLNYTYSGNASGCWGCLDSIPTKPSESEITVSCTWGGYTTSVNIHVEVNNSSVLPYGFPTGITGVPDVVETQVGQTITLEPEIVPSGYYASGYSGTYFCAQGLGQFAQRDWNASVPTYTVNTAGIFTDSVGIQFGPLMCTKTVTFKVKDANGKLPTPVLKLHGFKSEKNIYLGLENYGNGIGADLIGVWGETGWITASFNDYEELKNYYGGEPTWTISRGGQVIYNGSGYEDMDSGVLEYQLEEVESQPCDVNYVVTCEWGEQKQSFTTTVHYIQLQTVPTGHSYPEVVSLTVGDTLTINPTVEPANAAIPGYDYRVYVFDEQMDEFASLKLSRPAEKIYTVNTPGVYAATILLQADSVTIGKETIFRIADTNGVVPDVSPQLSSSCGFERNYWLVPGAVPGADGYGKLLSEDYLDNLFVSNESVCRHELQGDHVWSVSGSTDYVGVRVTSDGREELYLKKMPATAQTMTFNVVCSWGGQTGMVSYKLHFKNTPKGLPTGVYLDPDKRVRVVPSGKPFEYEFGFRNFDQIEGSDAWQDLSESLRDAVGWAEIGGQPGIYEGYVETGFDNVMWREKMTIIVTKSDGTMKKADYTPFGTVAPAPAGLKTIESQAFAGTKLTEVDIPAGVSISADAFDGTGLVAIYCHDQETVNYAVSHGYVAVVD